MKRYSITVILVLVFLTSIVAATDVPIYRNAKTSERLIALTFDDGPHPTQTVDILKILKEYDVKATFFMIGINVERYPEIAKLVSEEGHEIGNHTYNHVIKSKQEASELENEIVTAHNVIESICDFDTRLFRSPGGKINDSITKSAKKLGYDIILWDIDTRDWAHTSAKNIKNNILKNASNGSIILFHDYISGKTNTAEVLKNIIPALKKRGFEFVTVGELIKQKQ